MPRLFSLTRERRPGAECGDLGLTMSAISVDGKSKYAPTYICEAGGVQYLHTARLLRSGPTNPRAGPFDSRLQSGKAAPHFARSLARCLTRRGERLQLARKAPWRNW